MNEEMLIKKQAGKLLNRLNLQKNSLRKEKISNKIRRSTYQSMRAAILPE